MSAYYIVLDINFMYQKLEIVEIRHGSIKYYFNFIRKCDNKLQ